MNQYQRAKAMGISRTWLQVLEHRALNKVRAALGVPEFPDPKWIANKPKVLRAMRARRKACHAT